MSFERKRLRIEGFDYSQKEFVFFATLCARHHGSPFADGRLAVQIVESINWLRMSHRWSVFCYCVMPDHVHLVVSPTEAGEPLHSVISSFKKWTTRKAWECGLRGKLWQRGWYDHVARAEEDLLAMCQYVLDNPVRCGLVESVDEWPYCGMPDPLPI